MTMTIWKQKYEVTFKLTEEIKMEILLSFDNEEEKSDEEVLEAAQNGIFAKTDIDVNGKEYRIEKVVFIESTTDENYIVAKHLYQQEIELIEEEPEYERQETFNTATEETEVEYENVCLDETTNILKMLNVYFYEEEVI
jgi:hypothetical protein